MDGLDDAETWRWIWLGATLMLAISELAVPGTFFMLSFAAGALVACILAFADVSVPVQWGAFVAGSTAALAVLVPLGRKFVRDSPPATSGANRWEGRRAVVLERLTDELHTQM